MHNRLFLLCLAACFAALFSFAGTEIERDADGKVVSVSMEQLKSFESAEAYKDRQQSNFEKVMSSFLPLEDSNYLEVFVDPQEIAEMEDDDCETCKDMSRKKERVGLTRDVNHKVSFGKLDMNALTRGYSEVAGGLAKVGQEGFVWMIGAVSQDATAVRLHFTNVNLPKGAELYVFNDLGEAFGPYTHLGPNNSGDFWSHTVAGERIYVQLRLNDGADSRALRTATFDIAGLAHMGPKFLVPFLEGLEEMDHKAFCSFNASCVQDAKCYDSSDYSHINSVRNGIAHMQYVSGGGVYICTGGLLNDTDASTQVPYFLTANHCVSTSSEANSLEAYWQFWTTSCNGSCYNPVNNVPRTTGATIMSTSSNSDYTLMRLSQNPPSGSVFLGWSTTAVANSNNTPLYRISHPKGAPQAYSQHNVDTSKGTCSGIPRGAWIYSRDITGATEGGSSGSPILNASGQVVGQLTGACGTNLDNVCDSNANGTIDGAFAAYYSNIAQYLDPDDGGNPGECGDPVSGSASDSVGGYAAKYYTIDVCGGTINLNLAFNGSRNRDLDMYLRDPNGNVVATAYTLNNPEVINYNTGGVSGSYQIEVRNYTWRSTSFTLSATWEPQ